jgi:prepilin-type N-terminal cleavage/methylation domain-containing protein
MNLKHKQNGVTLIEILIGLALSLIVTSSMVALMGNSMGTSTRIIQMTQLSDELRNAMSMVSRDVRRANYSAHAIYCYANSDCGVDGTTTVSDLNIVGNCLTFNIDRDQDNYASAAPGGFRLADDGNGNGYLEMWVGDGSVDCTSTFGVNNDDWFQLTDPDFVDITTFNIVPLQIDDSIIEEGGGTLNQRSNTVQLEIIGVLRLDNTISRRIVDRIRVRNDYIWRS